MPRQLMSFSSYSSPHISSLGASMTALQLWPPFVPLGRLLVGVREGDDCGLGKMRATDLKADGQAGSAEAAWNRDRGQTIDIECSRIDNAPAASRRRPTR